MKNSEQTYEVVIDSIAGGGRGVGRLPDGRAVFVDRALPGSRVRVRLTKSAKRHAEAQIVAVLQASADEQPPGCEHFPACGGCDWQHAGYSAQLGYKRRMVVDALARLGGFGERAEVLVEETMASPEQAHFRNRMTFAFWAPPGDPMALTLGLRAFGDPSRVLEVPHCRIAQKPILEAATAALEVIRAWSWPVFDIRTGQGAWRQLQLRATQDGEVQGLLLVGPQAARRGDIEDVAREVLTAAPGLSSLAVGVRATRDRLAIAEDIVCTVGEPRVVESVPGVGRFALSPGTFFQTNTQAAGLLAQLVRDMAGLDGSQQVLDAYCGVGLFALALVGSAKELVAVESVSQAVEDGRASLPLNPGAAWDKSVEFHTRDVARALEEVDALDVAVLDPPRAGAGERVLRALAGHAPRRIVMVSCDPATLARDIKTLSEEYELVRAVPVDMFPHSHHVEVAAELVRKKG